MWLREIRRSTWEVKSVLEGVFDFGSRLFGIALDLIAASLGAKARVPSGAAEKLLGGALGGFGFMGDLFTDAHCGVFLRGSQTAAAGCGYRRLVGCRAVSTWVKSREAV